MKKTHSNAMLFIVIASFLLTACPTGVWAEDRLDSYAQAYHEYENSKAQDTIILKNIRDTTPQKIYKARMEQIRQEEEQQREAAKNPQGSESKK